VPRAAHEIVRRRLAGLAPANLGHRGAGINAPYRTHPENSIASFLAAVRQGAHGVEVDVELTADGRLVIMHDDTLDRTTTCRGCVSAYTLEQLQACRLLDGTLQPTAERPPTLEQVFTALPGDALVNVELKVYRECLTPSTGAQTLAQAAVREIQRLGVAQRTIFSSFSDEALVAVKAADPSLYAGLLCSVYVDELLQRALQLQVDAIHPNHETIAAEQVCRARDEGLQVNVWTVDSPADMDRALAMGVTTIITDEPGALAHRLAARSVRPR
jgi:glycerophosphoryl diester phosphodiesterase